MKIVVVGDITGLHFALAAKQRMHNAQITVILTPDSSLQHYDTAFTFPTLCRAMGIDPLQIPQSYIKLGMTYYNWETPGSQNIFTGSINLSERALTRSIYHDKYTEFNHSGVGLIDHWLYLYNQQKLSRNDFMPCMSETYGFAEQDVNPITAIENQTISDKFGWTITVDRTAYRHHLTTVAYTRGISIIEPQSTVVSEVDNNQVVAVSCNNVRYQADLYIDATDSRLIGIDLSNQWLPCDDLTNDIALSLMANSSQHCHTGTATLTDQGYILANSTPQGNQSQLLMSSTLSGKSSTFSPGWYQNCVVANCVLLGNAAGQVDPMDASENNHTNRVITFLIDVLGQPDWQQQVNNFSRQLFEDLDLVSQYKLRLAPGSQSEYNQILHRAAEESKLQQQLIDDICSMDRRNSTGYQARAYNLATLINIVLHYRLSVDLQPLKLNQKLADLSLTYFNFTKNRNKIIAT